MFSIQSTTVSNRLAKIFYESKILMAPTFNILDEKDGNPNGASPVSTTLGKAILAVQTPEQPNR